MKQWRWRTSIVTVMVISLVVSAAAVAAPSESTARFSGDRFHFEGSSGGTPADGLDYFNLDLFSGNFKTGTKSPFHAKLVTVTGFTWGECFADPDGTYTFSRTDWHANAWFDASDSAIDMDTYSGLIDVSVELMGLETAYSGIDLDGGALCSAAYGTVQPPVPTAGTMTFSVGGSWEPEDGLEPSGQDSGRGQGKKSKTQDMVPAEYSNLEVWFDGALVDVSGGETHAEAGHFSGMVTWPEAAS